MLKFRKELEALNEPQRTIRLDEWNYDILEILHGVSKAEEAGSLDVKDIEIFDSSGRPVLVVETNLPENKEFVLRAYAPIGWTFTRDVEAVYSPQRKCPVLIVNKSAQRDERFKMNLALERAKLELGYFDPENINFRKVFLRVNLKDYWKVQAFADELMIPTSEFINLEEMGLADEGGSELRESIIKRKRSLVEMAKLADYEDNPEFYLEPSWIKEVQ